MTWLLDGNLLTGYAISSHVNHAQIRVWFAGLKEPFATCATTQGTLLRLHMQFALDTSAKAAWEVLRGITQHPRHIFWEDGFSYLLVSPDALQGHRQVTDAWLAELARRHGGRVATLDRGFVSAHPDAASLIF